MKEPLWIDERDTLTLHDRLLVLHGGASGMRDDGLLKSALARPRQHFAHARAADIIQLAAIYTAGIVRNHPFVDRSERTGLVVGVLFLELNGFTFTASEEEAANAILALAAGSAEESDYAEFLRVRAQVSGAGS
jgi:death-on-curing protein